MPEPFRVLVTGSRTWDREDIIFRVLNSLHESMTLFADGDEEMRLVHGACPQGADAIAQKWWEARNSPWVTLETHPADWSKHGRKAGFIRNQEMVGAGAHVCHAFWRGDSRGTAHTINLARAAGIPTVIHRYPEGS